MAGQRTRTGSIALARPDSVALPPVAFRAAQEWGTTVPGYVDARVIERLWARLKEKGLDTAVRRQLLELHRIR